ncbi:Beta-galactosidase 7 [Hibiscus syriacus]|uniref:Beta-galactosidase 7 n=1 Tax=Hibiscus syriacus TaxID=106335 RepID=A0A6A3BN18_HIBSY|nr:Beta-galactosidase 7 [Hibiscus syriacus]
MLSQAHLHDDRAMVMGHYHLATLSDILTIYDVLTIDFGQVVVGFYSGDDTGTVAGDDGLKGKWVFGKDHKPILSPIQDIIDRISKLCELTNKYATKANPPHQNTVATNTATENQQDGSTTTSRGVSRGEDSQRTQKTDGSNKGKDGGGYSKTEALHELGKLYKELDYMYRSFQKLEKFENDLSDPLKTLEANVKDIVTDLDKDELPKQVPHNLRVLRNNITRVKILIPSQHQGGGINSEGNRGLQTTVVTRDAGDLPHLYGSTLFEESYYFKEIEEKYKSLKDDRLRLCFLCFAIFPENAAIKKRFLRFWWVGEELIGPLKEGEDEKDIVNETLNIFVEKGLIQPVLKKSRLEPRSYKMDPIVRSCLNRFAKDARFFDYDQEGKPTMDFSSCKKACMVRSEGATAPWFSEYLKEESGQGKLPVDLVKLQMLFNFPDRNTLMTASKRFDKLQILFNLSKQFPALPTEWFSKMTELKVLYMGKWETTARHIEVEDIDFLKGLKNMKNLRLLSLQGISGIPKIPSTIQNLGNLRILDLRACHNLGRLPDKIGSLKELTYLDLSECYLLDYMPKRLSDFKELQVLKGFVIVDTQNSCTLKDLSNLKNLRKLSINVNTTKFNIDDEERSLNRFQKLEKLRIAWGSRGMPNTNSSKSKSDIKNQQAAAKASTGKENKGDDKGSEANSKTTKVATGVFAATVLWRVKEEEEDLVGLANLVKLDLQCFPYTDPPEWLVPKKLRRLTNLSIRGGKLSYLKHDDKKKWKVDTLHLKFLVGFKMNWKEMLEKFPKLKYLENVRSPRITLCPCDDNGIWQAPSK